MSVTVKRVKSLLRAATKSRVLVVGDVMLDQFLWGRVKRISPEAPVPVVEFQSETYMPGGAANVASCVTFASLGSDLGGSVRLPGAFSGVVGLKPTYGRVSRHGIVPLAWSLDHAGPLTRCVEDAALIMNAISSTVFQKLRGTWLFRITA